MSKTKKNDKCDTDYDRYKDALDQSGINYIDFESELMIFLYEQGVNTHGVDLRFDKHGTLESFDTFFGEFEEPVEGEDPNVIYFTNKVSDICRKSLTYVAKELYKNDKIYALEGTYGSCVS